MRRKALVEARQAIGMTQEEVAEAVGVDRTTLGKWERDESTPQPAQRVRYAAALGVTTDALAVLLSGGSPDAGDIPDWLSIYLGMEQSATTIRAHEPRAVYGLLQTTAYTEALIAGSTTAHSSTYVQRTIEQRLYRQKRIRSGELEVRIVQPEMALRIRVGGPEIMAEQIMTIQELAGLPNVSFRISRYGAGMYEALRIGNFALMDHPWGNSRVHLESYGKGWFITENAEVERFSAVFHQAERAALNERRTSDFLQQLSREQNRGRNRRQGSAASSGDPHSTAR